MSEPNGNISFRLRFNIESQSQLIQQDRNKYIAYRRKSDKNVNRDIERASKRKRLASGDTENSTPCLIETERACSEGHTCSSISEEFNHSTIEIDNQPVLDNSSQNMHDMPVHSEVFNDSTTQMTQYIHDVPNQSSKIDELDLFSECDVTSASSETTEVSDDSPQPCETASDDDDDDGRAAFIDSLSNFNNKLSTCCSMELNFDDVTASLAKCKQILKDKGLLDAATGT